MTIWRPLGNATNCPKGKVPEEMLCLWEQQEKMLNTRNKHGHRWHPKWVYFMLIKLRSKKIKIFPNLWSSVSELVRPWVISLITDIFFVKYQGILHTFANLCPCMENILIKPRYALFQCNNGIYMFIPQNNDTMYRPVLQKPACTCSTVQVHHSPKKPEDQVKLRKWPLFPACQLVLPSPSILLGLFCLLFNLIHVMAMY